MVTEAEARQRVADIADMILNLRMVLTDRATALDSPELSFERNTEFYLYLAQKELRKIK